jgi:hypothetical protein
MKRGIGLFMVMCCTASPLLAQRLVVEPSRVYAAFAIGTGQLTPECDTGCYVDAMPGSGIMLIVGWHVNARLRVEAGGQRLQTTGVRSHAALLWAGVAWYPINNFFIRGGVGQLDMSIEDSVGVTEGKGAPGFTVGAGYDISLGSTMVLTPYASFFAGSISSLEHTGGPESVQTSGSVRTIHGGVSIAYRPYRREVR